MHEHYLEPDRIRLVENLSYPDSGLIIADAILKQHYRDFFERNDGLPTLYLPASEKSKNHRSLAIIYTFFTKQNLKRSDTVHIYGGGIICDLAAYGVATFKRGCRLKLYPTTLLAMVDAAIGGKCAVNYQGFKNQIGTFYPAEEITIYPPFLQTLKPIELRQGKAEMLKCYFISEQLSDIDTSDSSIPGVSQILEYAKFKMDICAQDPHDQGIRRTLNFGHTFGHVLERLSGYRFKHGDSVIAGISAAIDLSLKLGLIDSEMDELSRKNLSFYPLPAAIERFLSKQSIPDMLSEARQDKKNSGNALKMVLPIGYRKVAIRDVSPTL